MSQGPSLRTAMVFSRPVCGNVCVIFLIWLTVPVSDKIMVSTGVDDPITPQILDEIRVWSAPGHGLSLFIVLLNMRHTCLPSGPSIGILEIVKLITQRTHYPPRWLNSVEVRQTVRLPCSRVFESLPTGEEPKRAF